MFLDTRDPWPSPEPWPPAAPLPSRAERVVMRLVAVNLVLLFVAPIGGASLFGLLAWLWRG